MGWRVDIGGAHQRHRVDRHHRHSLHHSEFHEVAGCRLGNQLQLAHRGDVLRGSLERLSQDIRYYQGFGVPGTGRHRRHRQRQALHFETVRAAGYSRLGKSGNTEALHTGGIDIKYGLRSNLVANLTVNTDFADTDLDQQQFNLKPYKLFFPEKRPFFLENASAFYFSAGFNDLLFFSRQIGIDPTTGEVVVPIDGGGKITGSLGEFEVGVMDVKTRAEGPNPYTDYSVVRVKRSIFGDSYGGHGYRLGAMAIDKESSARSTATIARAAWIRAWCFSRTW